MSHFLAEGLACWWLAAGAGGVVGRCLHCNDQMATGNHYRSGRLSHHRTLAEQAKSWIRVRSALPKTMSPRHCLRAVLEGSTSCSRPSGMLGLHVLWSVHGRTHDCLATTKLDHLCRVERNLTHQTWSNTVRRGSTRHSRSCRHAGLYASTAHRRRGSMPRAASRPAPREP